jgi:hypothetical protein
MRSFSLTFCFLRLQDSHAWAVRCLLSGSTLGRVMATIQSGHSESMVIQSEAWFVLATDLNLELAIGPLLLLSQSLGSGTALRDYGSSGRCGCCMLYPPSGAALEMSSVG